MRLAGNMRLASYQLCALFHLLRLCVDGIKDFRMSVHRSFLALVELRPWFLPFLLLARDGSGMQVLVEMARQGKGFDLRESIQDLAEVRL